MTLHPTRIAAAAVAVFGFAATAEAQQRSRPPRSVTVENVRVESVVTLEIVGQDARNRPVVVGRLGKALGSGEATEVSLRNPRACVHTVRWSFETSSEPEEAQVDICKDRTMRLTD